MKYLLMSIFLWVFFSKSAIAQDSKFDSLKFYGMPYYSETHNRIDRYSIVVYGDSVHIKDKIMIQELFDNLKKLTKTSSNARLKNLRTDFEPDLINIRALFI